MVEGVSWFVTGVNASYLGKQNSIPPMFRVIQQCGRKHTAILKLALDILTNLTKSSRSPHCLSVCLSVCASYVNLKVHLSVFLSHHSSWRKSWFDSCLEYFLLKPTASKPISYIIHSSLKLQS